jgi:membrane protein required for colicin V production
MTWVDWAIVIVLLCSTAGGLMQGFFRTACSIIGLLFGLTLASWNYGRIAAPLLPLVRVPAVADAIGFLLIAILVGIAFSLIGNILGKAFDWLGLGCLDMIGGGLLGFLQGAVIITLIIMVAVAFFPQAQWLTTSQLPRQFFAACQMSTHMSPAELADRVRSGVRTLERESPPWMHSQT